MIMMQVSWSRRAEELEDLEDGLWQIIWCKEDCAPGGYLSRVNAHPPRSLSSPSADMKAAVEFILGLIVKRSGIPAAQDTHVILDLSLSWH